MSNKANDKLIDRCCDIAWEASESIAKKYDVTLPEEIIQLVAQKIFDILVLDELTYFTDYKAVAMAKEFYNRLIDDGQSTNKAKLGPFVPNMSKRDGNEQEEALMSFQRL